MSVRVNIVSNLKLKIDLFIVEKLGFQVPIGILRADEFKPDPFGRGPGSTVNLILISSAFYIRTYHFGSFTFFHQPAVLKQDGPVAELVHRTHIVTHEQHSAAII